MDDSRTADTRPEGEEHDRIKPAACTQPAFAQSGSVGVVLEEDGYVVMLAERRDDIAAVPAGERVGIVDETGLGIEGTGATDADAHQFAGASVQLAPDIIDRLPEPAHGAFKAEGGLGGENGPGEDPSGGIDRREC